MRRRISHAGRAARGGYSVVRSYMAHHVGMSMVACANAAFDDRFVRRFLRDPDMARAVELLNEQAPAGGAVFERRPDKHRCPQLPGRSRPEPRRKYPDHQSPHARGLQSAFRRGMDAWR